MRLFSKKNSFQKENELSRSYINAQGKLVIFESRTQKTIKQFSQITEILPPVAIFMICGLVFVQFYILIGGIIYHTTHPLESKYLRIYLFLFVFIGIALSVILKLAWLFAEKKDMNKHNKRHYFSDYQSYS